MKKILLSFLLIFTLFAFTNCAKHRSPVAAPTPPPIVKLEKPIAIASVPDPLPIQQQNVDWMVITQQNLPEGTDWVLFAITPEQYSSLVANLSDILRWVTESKWRLDYYKTEIEKIHGQQRSSENSGQQPNQ